MSSNSGDAPRIQFDIPGLPGQRFDWEFSTQALEKKLGKNIKDFAYAIGSGNYNSFGQTLFNGEGVEARKTREEKAKMEAQAAQDATDSANAKDSAVRSRIDAIGNQRRATPGGAATLLTQGYGLGGNKGTLLTPRGA